MRRLVILGGGSPFTIALIWDLLNIVTVLPPVHVVLYGRSDSDLSVIKSFCDHHFSTFSWTISYTTILEEALDGADVVIHQIRYGGLEGRLEDEKLAHKFGSIADETLGPSAINAVMRNKSHIVALAKGMVDLCPDALLINLTNPLSLTTALFSLSGFKKVVGLCELPIDTFLKSSSILGLNPVDLNWEYVGLNHRGFIYYIGDGKISMIDSLAEKMLLQGIELNGISRDIIVELDAIPLKYFSLYLNSPKLYTQQQPSRAEFLIELKVRVLEEIQTNHYAFPPSLSKRKTPWYSLAVVPFIVALWGDNIPTILTLNCFDSDEEMVVEKKCIIDNKGYRVLGNNYSVNSRIDSWMARFKANEHLVLLALLNSSVENMQYAISSDLLIPKSQAHELAREILRVNVN